MEIDEALRHAIDGNAVLFLGSGFNWGIKNKQGRNLPTAEDLSNRLMNELGEKETVGLKTSAEIYRTKKGNHSLFSLLKEELDIEKIQAYHASFGKINWISIYTTNYDSVPEEIVAKNGKKYEVFSLDEQPGPRSASRVQVLHINGRMKGIDFRDFDKKILITDASYVASEFSASPWRLRLQNDIRAARSIIFIGYSLYDIEIQKILVNETVRKKCVFVTGPNPSLALRVTLERYGTINDGGVMKIGNMLDELIKTYEPQEDIVDMSCFLPVAKVQEAARSPSIDQQSDLILYGKADFSQIIRSVINNNGEYIVLRKEINEINALIAKGNRYILVISRLANGKSLLLASVAGSMAATMEVYWLNRRLDNIQKELLKLKKTEKPIAIIIDDYTKYMDVIESIALENNSNIVLILSSRTPTHFTHKGKVELLLGKGILMEVRCDAMDSNGLPELDDILLNSGLLGTFSNRSKRGRIRHYEEHCASELSSILSDVAESYHIMEKIRASFQETTKDQTTQKVIVSMLFLQSISYRFDIHDLASLIGANPINQAVFAESSELSEFAQYSGRILVPRSSKFGSAVLRAISEDVDLIEVLVDLIRSSWELGKIQNEFRHLCRELMRYSNIRHWVNRQNRESFIKKYYDSIRNLPACYENELFWLQVAIFDIECSDFPRAERHLNQAYGIANKKSRYDTFQLDNTMANFLLSSEINIGGSADSFRKFREANRIVVKEIRQRTHAYYPFRVAQKYGNFWDRVASTWNSGQQEIFLRCCGFIESAIGRLDPLLKDMEDVVRCKSEIDRILRRRR